MNHFKIRIFSYRRFQKKCQQGFSEGRKNLSYLDCEERVDKFRSKMSLRNKVNVSIASEFIVSYGSHTPILKIWLHLLHVLITYNYTMVHSNPIFFLSLRKIFYLPIRHSFEFYCPGRGISVFLTMAAFLPLSRGFLVR